MKLVKIFTINVCLLHVGPNWDTNILWL